MGNGGRGFAQRLMRSPTVSAVYEDWWRPALGRLAKGLHGPGMAEEHRIAAALLGLGPGDVVLDVACGTGAFTRGFARRVAPNGLAIGLDASPTMLAKAIEAPHDAAGPVAYLRADAEHPPFRPGSLDAVCCFAALHLFDDPETALASFARVLSPGGHLALLTSARRPGLPWRPFDTLVGAVSGMRMFDRGEVTALLRARGFTDVQAREHGVVQIVGARRR